MGCLLFFVNKCQYHFIFIVLITANAEARIKALDTENEDLRHRNEYV